MHQAVHGLERVLAVQERTLAEEHPDRLASQHALGVVYHADGQIKNAVALLEQVLAVSEGTLEENGHQFLVTPTLQNPAEWSVRQIMALIHPAAEADVSRSVQGYWN
jgi:hypothetical protein